MRIRNVLGGLLAALFLIWSAPLAVADYSLDDMSEEDLAELEKLIEGLARVEVVMTTCVAPKHYDRKLREEIEACIVPESIERVQDYFDRVEAHFTGQKDAIDCQNAEFQAQLPEFEEKMDDALWRIGLMCDLCVLC